MLTSFSLLYVTGEFHRCLHRGRAKTSDHENSDPENLKKSKNKMQIFGNLQESDNISML